MIEDDVQLVRQLRSRLASEGRIEVQRSDIAAAILRGFHEAEECSARRVTAQCVFGRLFRRLCLSGARGREQAAGLRPHDVA